MFSKKCQNCIYSINKTKILVDVVNKQLYNFLNRVLFIFSMGTEYNKRP